MSALREIELALRGGYDYYYMGECVFHARGIEMLRLGDLGFYIHSCMKMRYKAAFKPTYILGSHVISILLIIFLI